jgi:F0F1-type ATP synthase epsilon subunit
MINTVPVVSTSSLSVIIKDRQGEVFSGQVLTVSSLNHVGQFDVMPLHANMVTTIQEKIVLQKTEGHFETIEIQSGLLRVRQNNVEIFVGL